MGEELEPRETISRTIGGHLRGHNVGYVALFIALTGTSVAAFDPVGSDGDVDLCVTKKTREVVLMKGTKCRRGQTALAVNQIGPPGQQGAAGSPDTPEQVLGKLAQVDGAGSGLDADSLDGVGSAGFVGAADNAGGGDLTGPFSNLQLAGDAVGPAEITNSLGTQVISYEFDPVEGGPRFLNLTDGTLETTSLAADEFMMPGPGLIARIAVENETAGAPLPNDGWGVVASKNNFNVGGCFVNGANTRCGADLGVPVSENDEIYVTMQPFGTPNPSSSMRVSVLLRPFGG